MRTAGASAPPRALAAFPGGETVLRLSADEAAAKRRLLALYRTAAVLAALEDFSRPPRQL